MFGNSALKPSLDPETAEAVARKQVNEVSERFGMGIEDVEVEYDPSMPYDVLGRTESDGDDQRIKVGRRFLEAPDSRKLETMAHEGFHVKQFRGEEAQWLAEEFDVSDEFYREVRKAWNSGDVSEIEGITEVVVDGLMPFEAGNGYPYEKNSKRRQLESKGIDVESELVKDVGDTLDDYMEELKDVSQSFFTSDIYFEYGEIGGFEYIGLSTEEEPGSAVNSYLAEELAELSKHGYLEQDSKIEDYLEA